jgi:hypothetical protein
MISCLSADQVCYITAVKRFGTGAGRNPSKRFYTVSLSRETCFQKAASTETGLRHGG